MIAISSLWESIPSRWLSLAGLVVLVWGSSKLLRQYLYSQGQSQVREPPSLPHKVPFIGHLLGIITKQVGHFRDVSDSNCNAFSAASLPVLNGKLYAIFEPTMMQRALRTPSLSFEPLMIQHAQGLLGVDDRVMSVIRSGLLGGLMQATKPVFAGEQLATLNLAALGYYAGVINMIEPGEPLQLANLYSWLADIVTAATSQALYGTANPIMTGSTLINDVWMFEEGIQQLSFNVLPSITARGACKTRERLVEALTPLFDPATTDSLPALSRRRAEAIRAHGITSPRDIARCELALLHVATVNTAPILFWLVVNIFSRPDLLEALRSECSPLMRQQPPTSGQRDQINISISSLQHSCPLLASCLHECLRVYGQALHSRQVQSDTVLADTQGQQYLFKKDMVVMMPSGVSHTTPAAWGPNAGEFDAARFTSWPENATREQRAAFMPYGGGKHLCPGRNFATAEILGIVAVLCLGTDIVQKNRRSAQRLVVPESVPAALGQAISKPKDHMKSEGLGVNICVRKGFEQVKWFFDS